MRRTLLPAVIIVALATPARAQAPRDTVQDLAAIRADLETVKSQLTEVLRLLRQRPIQGGDAPTGPVRASVADAPTLGRADAPVTLVEFSDYQCPFCQRFFATTLPAQGLHRHGQAALRVPRLPTRDAPPRPRSGGGGALCWRAGQVLGNA